MSRDPAEIQRDIETNRDELAGTLDQLATRLSPRRLAEQGRARAVAAATSPAGLAVLGAVALLVALAVARRARR